jgi:beta-lactamase regulating signal transducer with metallopeptidase domain
MSALPIVVVWGLKATPVFFLAWLAALMLRRSSAAQRHFVWTLAVAGALVLPLAVAASPRFAVPVLPARSAIERLPSATNPTAPTPAAPTLHAAPDAVGPSQRAVGASTVVGAPARGVPGVADLLWVLWATGATGVALLVAASLIGAASLARRARPAGDHALIAEFDDARRALGLGPNARLLIATGSTMPMTWGALHPVVLLPAAAPSWSPARQRAVLMHELAHVRRRDWLTQLAARVACALYWWNPLVWVAARKLREEREHACDDLVLAQGARASDYASELLDIARSLRAPPVTALAGVAMARPAQLGSRLLAVLDSARVRRPVPRGAALSGTLVAAALIVPAGGLRFARTAPAASAIEPAALTTAFDWAVEWPRGEIETKDARSEGLFVPGGRPRAGQTEPRLALSLLDSPGDLRPRTLCDWSRTGDSRSSSTHIDDHRATIRIVVDGCELHVKTRGRVEFSSDERTVSRLESDGYFEIEERRGGERRQVEFASRGGEVDRRWLVNGREQDWSAEAYEWLHGALLVMFRRTSFEARARAQRIHARAGKQGLVDEVAHLHSSSALATYFTVLLERERVTPQEARHLATFAGERISSSSALSKVLIALVTNAGTDEDTRAVIVRSAGEISSSSARARVLVAAVETAPLSPVLADAVLETAAGISSSSEKARVLIAVNAQVPADHALPASYVSTASGIGSSSALGRVLVDFLEREAVSSEQVATVLEVARQISSSSEKGRVLRVAVERHGLDERTRSPFFHAVTGISSSSGRERVLRAVTTSSPDPTTVAMVIESSRSIASSSSRADVLVGVAQGGLLSSEELRSAYRNAAGGISSRSERERALRALGDA